MSVGTADLHTGLSTFWANYLHQIFTRRWSTEDKSLYLSLNDTHAHMNNAWPYCVYMLPKPNIVERMCGGLTAKRVTTRYTLELYVHTQDNETEDAKSIGIELSDAIMQKLGGHPTVDPEELTIANGAVNNVQLLNEFGMYEEDSDDEYIWRLDYMIETDTPVKVLSS